MFSILLGLLIFTYTLIGLEFFANRSKINRDTDKVDFKNGISPAYNFDDFFNSFTTVFTVLSNDGWGTLLFNYYRSVNGVQATIFVFSLVLIG